MTVDQGKGIGYYGVDSHSRENFNTYQDMRGEPVRLTLLEAYARSYEAVIPAVLEELSAMNERPPEFYLDELKKSYRCGRETSFGFSAVIGMNDNEQDIHGFMYVFGIDDKLIPGAVDSLINHLGLTRDDLDESNILMLGFHPQIPVMLHNDEHAWRCKNAGTITHVVTGSADLLLSTNMSDITSTPFERDALLFNGGNIHGAQLLARDTLMIVFPLSISYEQALKKINENSNHL